MRERNKMGLTALLHSAVTSGYRAYLCRLYKIDCSGGARKKGTLCPEIIALSIFQY